MVSIRCWLKKRLNLNSIHEKINLNKVERRINEFSLGLSKQLDTLQPGMTSFCYRDVRYRRSGV